MIKDYIQYIISNTELEPQNILEIGARNAWDAHEIKNMFSIDNEKVYLVEPFPYHTDYIKSTFPQYKLFEYGISQQKGKFKFYGVTTNEGEISGMSSFLDRNDDIYTKLPFQVIELETITGKDLLDQIGEETIDMCDLDVEGMSYDVLVSFGEDISKIKTIRLECEEVEIWKGQRTYSDVRDYLESKNFIEVFRKPIYQKQLDLIYINKTYGEIISPIIAS
jgi:FkbM family methyltransferase